VEDVATNELKDVETLEVPIEAVVPNWWNPNVMAVGLEKTLSKSIQSQGLVYPVLVILDPQQKSQYVIVDGYHRWKACKESGATKIPVVLLRDISLEEAQKLTIVFNSARGQFNYNKLAELCSQWEQSDLGKQLGIDGKKLEKILKVYKSSQPKGSVVEVGEAREKSLMIHNLRFLVFEVPEKDYAECERLRAQILFEGLSLKDVLAEGIELTEPPMREPHLARYFEVDEYFTSAEMNLLRDVTSHIEAVNLALRILKANGKLKSGKEVGV